MANPRLTILVGLPGSGKSTLARQIQGGRSPCILISTDTIRAQLFGDEAIQGSWAKVWAEVQQLFRQAVQEMISDRAEVAIFDATNAIRRNRREVIATARGCGFRHLTVLWLDVPLEVCLQRNQQRDRQVPEEVIIRMHRRLAGAPPSVDEGIDCLLHYRFF